MFRGTVVPKDRSLMNVPFVTGNEELDAQFVKESKEAGFENLKGHRTVGGMRAASTTHAYGGSGETGCL